MSEFAVPSDLAAFRRFLDRTSGRIDAALTRLLPPARTRPAVVHEAMRYTALSEGKRLRPGLVVLAYEASGGRGRKGDAVGAALEMVHAFSLIHDDLPCMDDDDMRRGQPSNHVVYGEGVAVLAGDALLTHAFQALAGLRRRSGFGPEITARLIEELADATGTHGVIGGQVMDLLSEGTRVPLRTVDYIHRHKTARLFRCAVRLGGVAADAPPAVLGALTRYGEAVGMAFQIVDDILGAAGTVRELGREPGRDQARGKATYPSVAGFDASHRAVDRHLRAALAETERFRDRTARFRGLVGMIDARRRDAGGGRLRPGGKA